ncbi:MAG: hypothetical protein SPL08_00505, partial [Pseudomonadota bacterium]|nr:hypothetical protein [Pseudomonadota bacterium]
MKIAKRILHILFKAVEIFVAFILVIGGLGFGLLYLKPIEINEFLPTLETYILPKNSGLKLNAESMTLRAALENKGLFHIDIKNMTLNKEDNTPALELPDVEFSYSLKHILSLNYVPSDLTLKNAILYLIIGENGQVRLYGNGNEHKTEKKSAFKTGVELSADNNALLDNMIQQILSFRSLSMENTTVKVEDRQK